MTLRIKPCNKKNMEFEFKSYIFLISIIREHGYSFSNYHNYSCHTDCCILRHDVDMSLDYALKFAQLENEIGVGSTFFVLFTSDFYNVASAKSVKQIKSILSLGHEIGLHFDEVKYPSDVNLPKMIEKEAYLMSNVLDIPIKTVSMHRPSKKTLSADYQIDGLVNSYSSVFFKEFKYLSDSRMNWRENPLDVIQNGIFQRLHILTHPFWYREEASSMQTICRDFCIKALDDRYYGMSENVSDFTNVLRKEELK